MSRRSVEVAMLVMIGLGGSACASANNEGSRAPTAGTANTTSGGATTNAGAASGEAGQATGGAATGGAATAGAATAGAATGGAATGGAATSASGQGGSGTAGSSAVGPSTPWAFPEGVSRPRIMIVGDSISAGPGCYKKYLKQALTTNGYTNFEFVGEYTDDCGGGVMHSAVSCSTAEQYTQDMFTMPNCQQGKSFLGMTPLATKHKPDLVMLQLGVNDVWGAKPTAEILGNYAKLIAQARAVNPKVVMVVARIQKIRPDCSESDAITKRAEELVNAVPSWAMTQSMTDSPVFVADLWTSSDWSKAETNDCVHPNDVGAQKMGLNWYATLKTILKPG